MAMSILDGFEHLHVKQIVLCKDEISKELEFGMNIVSLGDYFHKKKKYNFVVTHASILFVFDDGQTVTMDKRGYIHIEVLLKHRPSTKMLFIENIPPNLKLSQIVQCTKAKMGSDFKKYHLVHQNCQQFIIELLNANDIDAENRQKHISFIKDKATRYFNFLELVLVDVLCFFINLYYSNF